MSYLTLDEAAIAKLAEVCQPTEIRDANGKVLGTFRPKFDPEKWGPLESQISMEELRRRADSKGPWYTTAEVLERLKKLEQEGR